MEIKEMTIEQLEERKNAIVAELDVPEADLDALESEARAIKEELELRKADAAKKAEIREAVASGSGEVIEKMKVEERKMTNMEIRNSAEYIEAFARYIKSGDDKEVRSLLTENVSGAVPVPEMVDEIVRTAWEKDQILSRVRKTHIRGNLKVAFERSADDAVEHTEGTTAPSEESLELGIVTMIPKNIKKWIRISDETAALGGEEFLRYVYDELTRKIILKLSRLAVTDIASANTSHSSNAVGVPKASAAPGIGTVAKAFSKLSDEATDIVVIINKLTYEDFYAAYAAGNFAVDPFMNFPVLYSSALPAYTTADDNAVYAIVGDLDGEQVNYPEGEGVILKYDELSESENDLIKIVGRQFAAHGVTAPGRFCNITKPAAVTT